MVTGYGKGATLDRVIEVLNLLRAKLQAAGVSADIPLLFYDDDRRDIIHLALDEYDVDRILRNPFYFTSITCVSIPLQVAFPEEVK